MGRQYSSRAGPYYQGFFMKLHVTFTRYRFSLFHSCLSLSRVLGNDLLTDSDHYGRNFFQLIKYAKEKAPLNPVLVGVKE